MKLSYRGHQYESMPSSVEMLEGEVGGLYRGRPWQVRYPRHMQSPHVEAVARYRGSLYQLGHHESISLEQRQQLERCYAEQDAKMHLPVAVSPKAAEQTEHSPKRDHKVLMQQVAQVHQQYLLQNLERRLASAKARGDQQLVNLLEAERQALV